MPAADASTWRGLSVTRRREDRTSDAGAHFIYLRDPWSGEVWSPSYQPICREPDEYEATFELEKVTFRRRDGDFETQLQVVVSPEDDVEVRRLSITNRGDRPREIEVTSYAEMVLARPDDDLAHPAFAKLFIETEYDAAERRSAVQQAPAIGRRNATPGPSTCSPSTAGSAAPSNGKPTARDSWAGDDRRPALSPSTAARCPERPARCWIRWRPCASVCGWRRARSSGSRSPPVSRTIGRRRLRWCGSTATRSAAARAFSMASTHVHITLQHLGLTDDQAMLFDRLASRVFGSTRRARVRTTSRRTSSVRPTCGVTGSPETCRSCSSTSPTPSAIALVRQLLHAQEYWRVKDLRADFDHPQRSPRRLPRRGAGAADEPAAGAALDRVARQTRRDVPAAIRRHAGRLTAICSRPSRASFCAAISAISRRSSIGRRPGCRRRRSFRNRAGCFRRSRRPSPVPVGAAGDGERHRRLHARRTRVCDRPRRRSRDASALVERPGEPRIRNRC